MDKQKEWLIELVHDAICKYDEFIEECRKEDGVPLTDDFEYIADYLLENGVIAPPCKVGNTVWCISDTKVAEAHVYVIEKWIENTAITLTFKCEYECDGCPFSDWSQDYYSGEYSCDGEYGETIVDDSDFGKTVFLTREEAEAALKERQEKE